MNQNEKTRVKELREEGLGYKEISNKLNLSINTVKSYCKRNGLGGVRALEKSAEEGILSMCKCCKKPIRQPKGRKQKMFCSDRCRNQWWNSHKEEVNKKANYKCICLKCGESFISYGNKNRKYCCHRCYISDRFGGYKDVKGE